MSVVMLVRVGHLLRLAASRPVGVQQSVDGVHVASVDQRVGVEGLVLRVALPVGLEQEIDGIAQVDRVGAGVLYCK